MDRDARLSPLGLQRLRLLECLGGNDPGLPGYFDPDPRADVVAAFREHIGRLAEDWAGETHPDTVRLLAAARLVTGDFSAARTIVDRLPSEPVVLDHGAGVCRVAPFYALRSVLPLPEELRDTETWLADSPVQVELQRWLGQYGAQLKWSDALARYELS